MFHDISCLAHDLETETETERNLLLTPHKPLSSAGANGRPATHLNSHHPKSRAVVGFHCQFSNQKRPRQRHRGGTKTKPRLRAAMTMHNADISPARAMLGNTASQNRLMLLLAIPVVLFIGSGLIFHVADSAMLRDEDIRDEVARMLLLTVPMPSHRHRSRLFYPRPASQFTMSNHEKH